MIAVNFMIACSTSKKMQADTCPPDFDFRKIVCNFPSSQPQQILCFNSEQLSIPAVNFDQSFSITFHSSF